LFDPLRILKTKRGIPACFEDTDASSLIDPKKIRKAFVAVENAADRAASFFLHVNLEE